MTSHLVISPLLEERPLSTSCLATLGQMLFLSQALHEWFCAFGLNNRANCFQVSLLIDRLESGLELSKACQQSLPGSWECRQVADCIIGALALICSISQNQLMEWAHILALIFGSYRSIFLHACGWRSSPETWGKWCHCGNHNYKNKAGAHTHAYSISWFRLMEWLKVNVHWSHLGASMGGFVAIACGAF